MDDKEFYQNRIKVNEQAIADLPHRKAGIESAIKTYRALIKQLDMEDSSNEKTS